MAENIVCDDGHDSDGRHSDSRHSDCDGGDGQCVQ